MAFAFEWEDDEVVGIIHSDQELDPDDGIFATLREAKREAVYRIRGKQKYLNKLEKKIRGYQSVQKMYKHRLFKTRRWLPVNFEVDLPNVEEKFFDLAEWLKQNTSSRYWFVAAIFVDPPPGLRFKYGKSFHFPCVEHAGRSQLFVFFSDDKDAIHYKLTHL